MNEKFTGNLDNSSSGRNFQSTRWSMVLAAGYKSEESKASPESSKALAELCEIYWLPVYAYVRRRIGNATEAQDLTQAFFEKMLEKGYLAEADPVRGRFRSFLFTAVQNFLGKEWEKAKTQKRGGDRRFLSLDFDRADSKLTLEPTSELTPDQAFERQWTLSLLQKTLNSLRDEYRLKQKGEQFDLLKEAIIGEPTSNSYAEIAEKLDTTESAVKMLVHRMRTRYRDILRAEIADTVSHPSEVDEEIGQLFKLFGK